MMVFSAAARRLSCRAASPLDGWTWTRSASSAAPPVTMRSSLASPKSIDKHVPVAEVTCLEFARGVPLLTSIDEFAPYVGNPADDLPKCERSGCQPGDGRKLHALLTTRRCTTDADEWSLWQQYPLVVDAVYCTRCERFFQPQRAPVSALAAKLQHAVDAMTSKQPLEAEFWLRRVTNQFPTALRPRVLLACLLESNERLSVAATAAAPPLPELVDARRRLVDETVRLFQSLPADEQLLHAPLMAFFYQNMTSAAYKNNRPDDGQRLLELHLQLPGLAPDERDKLAAQRATNQARHLVAQARELLGPHMHTEQNPSGASSSSPADAAKSIRRAAQLAAQAAELDPGHAESLFLLGKCAQRLGNADEAYNHFRAGWELRNKRDHHFALELCLTCCQLGSWREAVSVGEALHGLAASQPRSPIKAGMIAVYALSLLLNGQTALADTIARQAHQECHGSPPGNVTTVSTIISAMKAGQLTLDQARQWAKKMQNN